MGVYEDMANDAGYSFGTDENRQMAEMIYYHEQQAWQEYHEEQKYLNHLQEEYDWQLKNLCFGI